ncbi:hypothetical protein ACHHYP_12045 [Achlya hypogyna]|uniref:Transmembrane protein n=1 Tax=Achlya hypogyna TaxID=1202772 RepID=A0A1V9YHQ3_ACHHY|nr:hypothetical protein ACHHYP_12045 [Achlya hypogyna]
MRRGSGYAVVKEKSSTSFKDVVVARLQWLLEWISFLVGFAVVVLVAYDSVANNWAFNDFIGNGYQFMTPIADLQSASDLEDSYAFAVGSSVTDLSRVAKWMVNYTVSNLVKPGNDRIYVLSAGTFTINAEMNLCSIFRGKYPVDLTMGPVQLGVVQDAITFLRGEAFSHAFTDDATANLGNSSMGSTMLDAIGYRPARIQADLRLTQRISVANESTEQSFLTQYYRIYPKSYCTGCIPIAELGHGTCNLTMMYDDTEGVLSITKSTFVAGSTHSLGIMIQQNAFSSASHYLKFIALVFAVMGYLASRRTVQWQEVDVNATETFLHRVVKMVLPSYYPHASHAVRFDMFCYNSDAFVVLFTAGVILDINHAIIFTREVQVFNGVCYKVSAGFQLFALSTRLLWLNCAFLKLIKVFWNLVSTASYCGESKFMGLWNLSSVTSLYFSAILLFYVPPFIEYNNHVRVDVKNSVEHLDGIALDFLESFYVRGSGAIAAGLILNIVLITVIDHSVNYVFWRRLQQNSLARQAIFNSTSILMDDISSIDPSALLVESPVINCKARRLCTLQWFFMSHLNLFGLPEKELHVKKPQGHKPDTSHTTAGMSQLPSVQVDGTESTTRSDGLYLVAQGSDHHMHLLDCDYSDVKSLIFNIKILKNTTVLIK